MCQKKLNFGTCFSLCMPFCNLVVFILLLSFMNVACISINSMYVPRKITGVKIAGMYLSNNILVVVLSSDTSRCSCIAYGE